jgi:hypothetical protein
MQLKYPCFFLAARCTKNYRAVITLKIMSSAVDDTLSNTEYASENYFGGKEGRKADAAAEA